MSEFTGSITSNPTQSEWDPFAYLMADPLEQFRRAKRITVGQVGDGHLMVKGIGGRKWQVKW